MLEGNNGRGLWKLGMGSVKAKGLGLGECAKGEAR